MIDKDEQLTGVQDGTPSQLTVLPSKSRARVQRRERTRELMVARWLRELTTAGGRPTATGRRSGPGSRG